MKTVHLKGSERTIIEIRAGSRTQPRHAGLCLTMFATPTEAPHVCVHSRPPPVSDHSSNSFIPTEVARIRRAAIRQEQEVPVLDWPLAEAWHLHLLVHPSRNTWPQLHLANGRTLNSVVQHPIMNVERL